MNFFDLQLQVAEWSRRNFGPGTPMGYSALLGVVEEVGELSHSHLKQLQGIRGTATEHEKAGQDAVGDILIYLADYCTQRGWDLQGIIEEVWGRVGKRDWHKDKLNGGEA
jgi:NTP pyrophosphatase (non-canonical NTP hydrolase)